MCIIHNRRVPLVVEIAQFSQIKANFPIINQANKTRNNLNNQSNQIIGKRKIDLAMHFNAI